MMGSDMTDTPWCEITHAEAVERVATAAEWRRRLYRNRGLAAAEAIDAESIRMYRAARDERDQLAAYLVGAFERGADASEYARDIAAFRCAASQEGGAA